MLMYAKDLCRLVKTRLSPTPEIMRERGRRVVDTTLAEAGDKEVEAENLYYMAEGQFNVNERQDAFDEGVTDRLSELGYVHPLDR